MRRLTTLVQAWIVVHLKHTTLRVRLLTSGHLSAAAGGNGARIAAGREGLKTGEDPGASLRDDHGVNNPPLARVWSNHRMPETDNGAQMAAATPVGGE